ncbi:DNA repair protein RecO [bacterium]|nr:DNA repair protein RecO [bacterium]
MFYKTPAVIIRRVDLKNADRLIIAYTKEFGKVSLKAKSVKKETSKLKGHLELFILTYLMFAEGKNLNVVTGAETINPFHFLHSNLVNLFYAYYFSEILDKMIVAPERDIRIWNLVSESFYRLDSRQTDLGKLRKNFESSLLNYLGYGFLKDSLAFIQSICYDKIYSYKFLKLFKQNGA